MGLCLVMKYIASISFGKDSLAMLLLLMQKKYPLDEVIFYDTGMEFQAIYDTRDKVHKLLEENQIKYTELTPKIPFLIKMLEKQVNKQNGEKQYGYGLCGGACRWRYSREKSSNNQILKIELWK